ncbi:Peptidase C19 ubiquitin carboxyl-terminal hydrolase 2 [Macrophomina phaseolina MS6]|uniref:Ubiquitin carboxyl-terminal hydrolase n=1 Tax=Macrophomina phaseolina (strain MS6) TaxID=1126212 RepID=K2RCH7_MACPH|nr:Peptidase C19 ubiquitin carboxyl-terminal hydrolase 2 [Macrophomina phaseolina MS6]
MPDKPLTIATYAAGASLAAITLVYVFGPTFFLDDDSANSARKKGVVGLSNPANDCFINSVLQALAGLPNLRLYLIRETHRRALDGPEVYKVPENGSDPAEVRKDVKLDGLQQGIVTHALKEVLDRLNERPIYRKTISAQSFVNALERAFLSRISRQQQDAQEFLQIVAERVCEEYHAGQKARRRARRQQAALSKVEEPEKESADLRKELLKQKIGPAADAEDDSDAEDQDDEEGFPFEGQLESQIECLTCHFKPKPAVSSFVTLTLAVPHQSSTSLNQCFDGMLKVEHIDDFKCEYCRLQHAIEVREKELEKSITDDARGRLKADIVKLRQALKEDPEKPPKDVELPDSSLAPKRRIARHMRILTFPKILAVHLSRSLFTAGNYGNYSTKNMAKVAFPETLPLGGILDQRKYHLLGVVTHKGGHNSGHYESFRRQVQIPPYSTPHSFGTEGVYSLTGSPNPSTLPSTVQSPRPSASREPSESPDPADLPSPAFPVASTASLSSKSSFSSMRQRPTPTSAPRDDISLKHTPSGLSPSKLQAVGEKAASKAESIAKSVKRRPKRRDNRWWRISDDKVKESKTSDVLGMQKEVYLLFYEIARPGEDDS